MGAARTPLNFSFVQLSDPQFGFGGYEDDARAFEMAVAEINAMDADFVLICGDLTHAVADEKVLAHVQRVRNALRVPSFCVPGNHDVGNVPTPETLRRWRRTVGRDQQVLRWKGCRFVLMNTQLFKAPLPGETNRQSEWLDAMLADAVRAGERAFVVGHVPLFTDDPNEEHEYYNLPLEVRRDLLARFRRHGVTAYLTGHIHRNLEVRLEGVHQVSTASTSFNYDGTLRGFRVWRMHPGGYTCRYHGLTGIPTAAAAAA